MVFIFLVSLIALALKKRLKRDYERYSLLDTESEESGIIVEEGSSHRIGSDPSLRLGWRQVHGDVFRAPTFLPFFAALIGTGWQLVVTSVAIILVSIPGVFHNRVGDERGKVFDNAIFFYCLGGIVAGYKSRKYFTQYYSATTQPDEQEKNLSRMVTAMTLTQPLQPLLSS